jgi:hypothetical protein
MARPLASRATRISMKVSVMIRARSQELCQRNDFNWDVHRKLIQSLMQIAAHARSRD